MKNESTRISRRRFVSAATLATAALSLPNLICKRTLGSPTSHPRRIPVVLATDIGGDIDDTWALGLLLKSPELDLKLVVTDYGKPQYRGTLIAKFLQTTGHGDISIGLGPDVYADSVDAQAAWLGDYDLRSYKGTIHQDGAKALVDTLMTSPEAPTLISIGPTPTIAAALTLEPRIADRTRFVGMFGSIRVGYYGSQTPSAETNVKVAVKPAQQVLSAPWNITITPLDTCGLVTLEGDRYRRLLASKDPVVAAIIENYRLWTRSIPAEWSRALDPDKRMSEERSTVLYDTAAIYLAITQDLCTMERLDIRVTDDGFTRIDPSGKPMNVASAWKDLEAYKDFLVNRLLGNAPVRK